MRARSHARAASVPAAVASILGFACAASAQESNTSETRPAGPIEEVTVTGSRITQREDFVSPNPIASFNSSEMQNLGIVNISEAVTQIPANVSNMQVSNTGGSAFFVGSTLANLRGLNPFFGTRTLTLVDSRRFVPTNQGGSVDLNFIPSVLIDRVEVVTGGASAAYGSEAVSGVVNILLNHKLEGLKAEVDYGASTHGDSGNTHLGLAGGTDLFSGRAHFVLGAEYQKQDLVESCAGARDWCAKSIGTLSNGGGFFDPAGTPYMPNRPGQPHNTIVENRRQSQASYTGVIWSNSATATTTLQANASGAGVQPFNMGQYSFTTPGASAVGGDGRSIYDGLTLMPELERKTVFAHLTWNLTDSVAGFLEMSYGNVTADNPQEAASGVNSDSVNVCINPDNAYIQGKPELQAALAAASFAQGSGPNASFSCSPFSSGYATFGSALVRKDFTLETDQHVATDTDVVRGVIGLNGPLTGSWVWDGYYQVGRTERAQIGYGYRSNHRFLMAVDSVIDTRAGSPTFGQPVCRVTLTGTLSPLVDAIVDPSLREGCVPLNALGLNAMSDEARAYAFGDLTEFNTIKQHVVAASASGGLWRGWGAGPLLGAVGLEHRREELVNDAGELAFAERTDFVAQYGNSFSGKTRVTEAFFELEMPLMRDMPGAKLWMLNAAARRARYETQGGIGTTGQSGSQDINTWKISSVWDPLGWMRLRGSLSRDVRAAGFRELYYSLSNPAGGLFTFGNLANPWKPESATNPFAQNEPTVITLMGNPDLKPESADTRTIGFVLSPGGFARGLQFSMDYYDIELKDGIVLGSSFEVVRRCYEEDDESQCALITFGDPDPLDPLNPRSNITEVLQPYLNANPYKSTGIDFSLDYALPLSRFSDNAKGNLFFRVIATRALETQVQSGGRTRDIAGQTGGDQGFLSDFASAPDWAGNLIVTYAQGPYTLTAQGRYTSTGVLDLQTPKTGPDDPAYDPNLTGSVSDNTVPSFITWNFSGSYDMNMRGVKGLQFFATVNNVFDRDPPFSAGQVGGANAVFFDALGRSYRVGMRARF